MEATKRADLWKDYNKQTAQLLKLQDDNIHRQVEEQLVMKKQSDSLVFYYMEAIV